MPFIQWSDEISTGIKTIDDEHKRLFEMANDLFDAIYQDKGPTTVNATLNGLVLYVATHFAHEEEYLFITKYPDFQAHVEEHDRLRFQVMRLQTEAEKGATDALANELFSFLKSWIMGHILYSDRAFIAHLKANGVE